MVNEIIIGLLCIVSVAIGALLWQMRARRALALPQLPGARFSVESPGAFVVRIDCALLTQTQLDDWAMRLRRLAPKHCDLALEHANDASWAPFAHIPTIERLNLSGAKIGISTFREFVRPEILEVVHLRGSSATDEMVVWLGVLAAALEEFVLAETSITDHAVAALIGAASLGSLDLSGTRITDASLRTLAGATKLYELDLSNTVVSDEGILWLRELPALASVTLAQTRVTAAGRQKLEQGVAAAGRKIQVWL